MASEAEAPSATLMTRAKRGAGRRMPWKTLRRSKIVAPLIFFAGLSFAYVIGFCVPSYGLFHDDGIYLATAKSMATGHGYRILSLPDELLQSKYPPVFPLSLSIIWKVVPDFPLNLPALKLVPLASSLGWLGLAFVYVREKSGSPAVATWTALFAAASPWVLFFSVTCLSETMFGLFLTGAVLVLTRACASAKPSSRTIILASVLSAASILTRTAGLAPLLFAGTLSLLLNRKMRSAATYFAATAILVLPWILWSRAHSLSPGSAEEYYSGTNYSTWNLFGDFTWPQRHAVILTNAVSSLLTPGILMGVSPSGLGAVVCPLVGIFVIYGFVLEARRGFTPIALFLAAYEGMLLLWAVPPSRFLVPVLPFLLFFGYTALKHFLGVIVQLRQGDTMAAFACALLLVFAAVPALYSQAREATIERIVSLPSLPQPNWDSLTSLMQWVEQNTPPNSVLAGGADPFMYLSTGRRAVNGFRPSPFEALYSRTPNCPLGSPSEFAANIVREKVDYVVRATNVTFGRPQFLNNLIDAAVGKYPEAFSLATRGAEPGDMIYRVNRPELIQEISR
jgi:hypothetical protein